MTEDERVAAFDQGPLTKQERSAIQTLLKAKPRKLGLIEGLIVALAVIFAVNAAILVGWLARGRPDAAQGAISGMLLALLFITLMLWTRFVIHVSTALEKTGLIARRPKL